MISAPQLEELVLSQKESFLSRNPGIPREIDCGRFTKSGAIVVITGIRRCGKSTFMRQLAEQYSDFLYVNFDDDRLMDFTVADFPTLMLVFEKTSPGTKVLFIDEVQNVTGWERFVRRVHDEGYKVFLTGSNANLLSAELGTRLTGRYTVITLYPFSFREVLRFLSMTPGRITEKKKAAILAEFDRYLDGGGFPEYLKFEDPDYLKRTYDDILYRDIISRYGIREVKGFRQLARYIFTNLANAQTYNALKNTLGFKSVVSVRDYVGFLEEAYLVFEIFRYDFSLKKQYVHEKKLYCIDTGMRNAVAFRFSDDRGRLLENLVLIELLRRGLTVFFFKNPKECDFVTEDRGKITSAIQVCFELSQDNRDRETGGLVNALQANHLKSGLILTYHQEEYITEGDVTIQVMPVWKWLIDFRP
ncbi:MAG: AAA family ATPase [Methanomicrobiales archaeon HGW-Methanomicrobiales-3]|nr:MAG: AAA family ATPase [Methanomicrobiales archaeon HGW-Methanomicrobiales-3]